MLNNIKQINKTKCLKQLQEANPGVDRVDLQQMFFPEAKEILGMPELDAGKVMKYMIQPPPEEVHIVGDEVRIGSDSMLVAPVTIGDGAYTAAGSVITEDVPPGAMGVARERQRNILGWVLRKRSGTSSEIAARKAGAKE